jgi:hypothetical protein
MTDNEGIIRRGRACVRLIEAIEVLVANERRQDDRDALLQMSAWAKQRLRQIMADSDPATTTQIMAASDKRLGTVKDVMLN